MLHNNAGIGSFTDHLPASAKPLPYTPGSSLTWIWGPLQSRVAANAVHLIGDAKKPLTFPCQVCNKAANAPAGTEHGAWAQAG